MSTNTITPDVGSLTQFFINSASATKSFRSNPKLDIPNSGLYGRAIMEKYCLTELRTPVREEIRISWVDLMINYPQFSKSVIITKNVSGFTRFFGKSYNNRLASMKDAGVEGLEEKQVYNELSFGRVIEFNKIYDLLVNNLNWVDNKAYDPSMDWIKNMDYLFVDLTFLQDEMRSEFKSRLADRLYCREKRGNWVLPQFFAMA